MKEEYYTAKEAMQLLRKPSTSFYREVREGRIPHKGKRPNMRFPKEAIDALAEVDATEEEDEKLRFIHSTLADAWTKQEITRQPYGDEDVVPFKTVLEWRKRNDDISMHVEEKKRILGWTTFLPLDENVILDLIHDRIREKDIPPQAIKKWTDEQLSVYIPIIEVLPSDNTERDKKVGAFLLRKSIQWAVMLMIQYDIKNWYGIGTTLEGQAILEKLGFRTLTNFSEGHRKGYMLESKAQPVRLIHMFLRSVE
ncbi:MAG: helix-turn-helix domain-containing protein [Chloroflexota bacterium]|nr:helix-turn-helix domain-containing protein [Chloroflexota bacterium]